MNLGRRMLNQPEAVEVDLQLLAEVIVGGEADHAQRRLEIVEVGVDARPVEDRKRPAAINVLPGVDVPDDLFRRRGAGSSVVP